MNEWPSGWFRDEKPAPEGRAGGPNGPGQAPGGPNEPTAALPARGARGAPAGGGAYAQAAGGRSRPSAWPEQPPLYGTPRGPASPTRPRPPRPAPGRGGRGGRMRRPHRARRILLIAFSIVLVLLVAAGATYFYLDSKLHRSNVLVDYSGRPAAGAGTNWLITGSDSRQGLTRAQERQLHTGIDIGGHRSDTILILHIPSSGGRPVLISLPRDSYVEIPGYGNNKINAAYSFGGPRLLAKTVQDNTGLRIDHYVGIGFGGLVNVVNAVGGVNMCLPRPVHDRASGLDLKAGCQTLDGAQALAYVRDRHTFSQQDLQRIQDQRVFLRALLRKATSPGTLINPFATVPAAFGATGAVKVDSGTHLYQLLQVALALRNPETTTVPIANANYYVPGVGDAVQWDNARANRLFHDLNNDQPVPKGLLSGSRLGG
ncbi:MAG TPA: LCP family protein [Streptosporangiaceae bacterium]|nr:LCP family protein [Streptosporangiaceae bacterium]